jgi:hypothetical protein
LRLSRGLNYWRTPVYCVAGLAAVAAAAGDARQAGRLWAGHQTLERELGYTVNEKIRELYDELIHACSDAAAAVFATAAEEGAQLSYAEILDYALSNQD